MRDPAGWKHLQRLPRLWAGRAISANRPGCYEARARALAGEGMLLDDALRHFRPGGRSTGPWLEGDALAGTDMRAPRSAGVSGFRDCPPMTAAYRLSWPGCGTARPADPRIVNRA
jgi:hypothetical protein